MKPHDLFPFDIFGSDARQNLRHMGENYGVNEDLLEELMYVQDHCMMPPFPWGQIMYHDFIRSNIISEPVVPGDFAEFGIGQGGTSIFFARMAKRFGRKFLAVDSFEGLPPVDLSKDNHYFLEGDYRPREGYDQLEQWNQYKKHFDVDDELYTLKGFFKDVEIPECFDKFAFVHLDSDLYDSMFDSLEKVWDRISPGGCVAVDDFFHHAQGPARAVSDFFKKEAEPPLLYVVPTYGVLIIKGRSAVLKATSGNLLEKMHSPRALDGNFYSFKLMRMCKPFLRALEASVERVREAEAEIVRQGKNSEALARTRFNAESLLAFMKYPDDAARSGADIMRYLLPLEDQWDISQGSLCGISGEGRRHIEFII